MSPEQGRTQSAMADLMTGERVECPTVVVLIAAVAAVLLPWALVGPATAVLLLGIAVVFLVAGNLEREFGTHRVLPWVLIDAGSPGRARRSVDG